MKKNENFAKKFWNFSNKKNLDGIFRENNENFLNKIWNFSTKTNKKIGKYFKLGRNFSLFILWRLKLDVDSNFVCLSAPIFYAQVPLDSNLLYREKTYV